MTWKQYIPNSYLLPFVLFLSYFSMSHVLQPHGTWLLFFFRHLCFRTIEITKKINYVFIYFTYDTLYLCSSEIILINSFCLKNLPEYFLIGVSLLTIKFLSFCLSWKILISKDIFTGYRIWGWKLSVCYFSSTFKLWFHCLLVCMFSDKKSAVILILLPPYIRLISLALFRSFSLFLVFSYLSFNLSAYIFWFCLIYISFLKKFLDLILFDVLWAS